MRDMALKLPQYFYLLMGKPLDHYLQVRLPYYQSTQCSQTTPIPVSSRWQVRSEKAKKEYASIYHCYHLCSSSQLISPMFYTPPP